MAKTENTGKTFWRRFRERIALIFRHIINTFKPKAKTGVKPKWQILDSSDSLSLEASEVVVLDESTSPPANREACKLKF